MTKKKRIKARANEMMDADIQYISLVERGANRAPIRIIKSEEVDPDMKTQNIFKTEISTHVAAILVNKGDNYEEIRKKLDELGFDTMLQEEHKDHVKFIQKDADDLDDDYEETPLKMSDDVTFVMTSKAADFSSLNSTFGEAIKKAQFFPLLGASLDAIHDVVVTNVTMADQIDKDNIKKSLDDFGRHIMTLVENLPEQVVKAEKALREISKGGAGSTDQLEHSEQAADPAPAATGDAPGAEKPAASASESEDTSDEGGSGSSENEEEEDDDSASASGDGAEGDETPASASGEENPSADGGEEDKEKEQKNEITTLLKGLSDKLDKIDEKADKAIESSNEAKEVAQKTSKRVSKIVKSNLNDGDGGGENGREKVKKSPFANLDGIFAPSRSG